ncbi:hypothetical protein ACET3X_009315 [Alternaria dauci]|uniref:PRP38-assoc multi-domain protein n=1 Tax=Alternaria dauci TaxID=48095 RepID=A0ABR3UA07_9PLEO
MAALAFKAISYGAEQIPDKFFEKIPGGYFTPAEQKEIKKNRKDRSDRKARERRHSEERSSKRNSRQERSPPAGYSDYYTDDTDYERDREQRKGERRRAKSVGTSARRSPSRGRHGRHSSDLDGQHSPPRDMAQPQQGQPYFPPPPTSEYKPYNPQEYAPSSVQDHRPYAAPAYGYSPQPASAEPRGASQDHVQRDAPRSSRYTPGPGYAPSPAVDAPIPPPPVGSNSPMNPYHHTDFPAAGTGYQPSPPPFSRQRSNSQPSFTPVPSATYPTYIPPSAEQPMVAYNESQSRSRRESTKPRREHRHRARSVDSHSHQSRSSKDHRRDDSRMTKVRDRFDSMDLREKSLAASVGGAAAGALGARQIATRSRSRSDRRSTSRSRSRSRSRTRAHERERSKGPGLRARSRSVIDRFRSKSRGHDDRDSRRDDRRDRDRRPDHGYDYGRDDYDYFSSDSEGDGSPVKTKRHRRRDY